MPETLTMRRIATKIEDLFNGKINLSDIKNREKNKSSFYSRAIAALSIMMQCGTDEKLSGSCITDGYHDIGIDAVYNDYTQKKLVLVQSKWRADGNGSISQEEASAFAQGVKRIINSEFDGCNAKILAKQSDIIAALKDMEYQIEMVFCHTGNQSISAYAKTPISDLLKQVNEEDVTDILIFKEIRLQEIYDFLANSQVLDNISIDDVILSNWGTIDEPFKAYYGTIPASALGEWYLRYGNRLFAKNIRFYKGSTDVNQGIKEVLRTEPEKFFYFNNGIKLLCRKITRKAAHSTDRITGLSALEGVSLVNGAQTTGSIGAVFAEAPEAVAKAKVFIQMIDLADAEETQATQITKFTNTQNRIEGKDFAALDPQQERIKDELSFSNIQYLYKSGAVVEDPARQISLDEAIIAQACSADELSVVATAKRNIGALTENINKVPYKLLFNGGTNSFALVNNVRVARVVDSFLSQEEATATGRKRLVLVHGNRFLLHMVLSEIKHRENYSSTFLDVAELPAQVIPLSQKYWDLIFVAMEECYPDAYPAHIFKNIGRLKDIKERMSINYQIEAAV